MITMENEQLSFAGHDNTGEERSSCLGNIAAFVDLPHQIQFSRNFSFFQVHVQHF